MFMGAVCPVIPAILTHLVAGNGSVLIGQHQYFMAGGLDGAGLMAIDMSGICTEHALIGPQHRGDDGGVGLRTAHQEMHICRRGAAGHFHQFSGPITMGVQAVSRCLFHIGGHHALQNAGMTALGIVTLKIDHRQIPFSISPGIPDYFIMFCKKFMKIMAVSARLAGAVGFSRLPLP